MKRTLIDGVVNHRVKKLSKVKVVFLTLVFCFCISISVIISPYHVGGDQVHYNRAYIAVYGLGLSDALVAYRATIFSFEPIHFIVAWLFSNLGFNKVFAMAILNGFVAMLLGRLFLLRNYGYLFVGLVIFTNHYMYAVFFTLEKLKIAILFLLLFLNFRTRIFALLAMFAHLQIALLLLLYSVASSLSKWNFVGRTVSLRPLNIIKYISLTFFFLLAANTLGSYAKAKLLHYSTEISLETFISSGPALFLGAVTYLISGQSRKLVFWYFVLLGSLIVILGGDRINMYALFGFLYFAGHGKHKGTNGIIFYFVFLVCSVYFGYKSLSYLYTVLYFGG